MAPTKSNEKPLALYSVGVTAIPCNAASRPTVIDKDQPIKSLGSMNRDEVSTARLHLKMVFAHGPTLVGRQRCMGYYT